jgi:hypothetical protein
LDPSEIDATIKFTSHSIFWTTLNGGEKYEEGVNKGYIKQSGSPIATDLVRRKLFKLSSSDDEAFR